jgi:predicted DNA-binding transcriptional regulator AlpA
MAMPEVILRLKEVLKRLACGKTKFEDDYRYRTADKPYVPDTDIPRIKPIPLGERNIGFLQSELDALIAALAKLRRADAPVDREPIERCARMRARARAKRDAVRSKRDKAAQL